MGQGDDQHQSAEQEQRQDEIQNEYTQAAASLEPKGNGNSEDVIFLLQDLLRHAEEEGCESQGLLRAAIDALRNLNGADLATVETSPVFEHFTNVVEFTRQMRTQRNALFEANEINKTKNEAVWAMLSSNPTDLSEEIKRHGETKDKYHEMKSTAKAYRTERDEERQRVEQVNLALEESNEEKDQLLAELDDLKRGRKDTREQPARSHRSSFSRSASAKRGTTMHQGNAQTQRLRFEDNQGRRRSTREPTSETTGPIGRRSSRERTQDTTKTVDSINVDQFAMKSFTTDHGIPNPSKFNGDKLAFYPWLSTLELKLKTSVFRSHQDSLDYVLSFLEGQAWALCSPKVQSTFGRPCANPYQTVHELIKHLVSRYGDINTKNKARSTFQQLKQDPSESFSDFHARFQACTAYLSLEEDDEMFELKDKLNGRYGQKVNDGTDYTSLSDLVRRARNLEDTFRSNDQRTNQDRNGARKPTYAHAANGQSNSSTNNRRSSTSSAPTAKQEGGSSQFPTKYRNLKPLNDAERDQLRKEGKCLRCRDHGHMQFEKDKCLLGKFSYRQLNSNSLTASTPDNLEDSGKVRVTA